VTEIPYRIALIVGAGSGISASLARALAAAGRQRAAPIFRYYAPPARPAAPPPPRRGPRVVAETREAALGCTGDGKGAVRFREHEAEER